MMTAMTTSVLRTSIALKIAQPRPQEVAAIISPAMTTRHARAKPDLNPDTIKGSAPGSTTFRNSIEGGVSIIRAARIQTGLIAMTPMRTFTMIGQVAENA